MASSSNAIIPCSSSSSQVIPTYDVFVSFRGEDIRNNFAAFLFQALRRYGIDAFKDDENLRKGESIAPELLQAIEGSRIYVVVFSKHYASSTWCLLELAYIYICSQKLQRRLLPIFLDVDPSCVRKQSGLYEEAFAEHEERFRHDEEKMKKVQTWKKVLTKVADISGWDIQNQPQDKKIEEIVVSIKNILGPKILSLPNNHLVGMKSRVQKLEELLCLGSNNDVRVIGISGMIGIGKSTIARALYEKISHQYVFNCFIDDVSRIYRDGTLAVQKQLLSQCLNGKNVEIHNVYDGSSLVWRTLHNKRAFIVFDNVDQVDQLKMFTGRETRLIECLGRGSRIIIIPRDKHILKANGVNVVYRVELLKKEEAVQLFCTNAFQDNYIKSGYEEFIDDILQHANGHPLALKVLGSHFFDRNIPQWKSELAKLTEQKSKKIMDVLQIVFDDLDDLCQEIFLDIACFFDGYKEQHVKEILDCRKFYPECGLQDLICKSLITIEIGEIYMHSLLKDLGRWIVKKKSSKEQRNWSRLWEYQDLHKIMSNDMAAKNLEVIVLDDDGFIKYKSCETTMRADAFSKMIHLKLLKFDYLECSGSLNYLSNELVYVSWKGYPFECLPPCFQPNNLVELCLSDSNITQLWEDKKPLPNLRRLDLSDSPNLIKIPDFGEALNLELVNLEGCVELEEINPSIGYLTKLTLLNLSHCSRLIKLPHFREDLNLEMLNLSGCINLQEIHPSIGLLRKLTFLDLKDCKSLTKLPNLREGLNLESLNLEGCIKLEEINPSIGLLPKLTFLNLKDCKSLVSLPKSILGCKSLEYLCLSGCSKLKLLDEPRDAEHSKKLCMSEAPIHSHSTSFVFIPRGLHKDVVSCLLASSSFPFMRQLDLSFCNLDQIPEVIGNLRCLEMLNLSGNNFATLPSFKELSKLYYLDLQHCKQLKQLPELPSRTNLPSKTYTQPWPTIKSFVWPSLSSLHMSYPPFINKQAGLNIFNCPELVEWNCTNKTISWMKQILQAGRPFLSSISPGSEIPSWFDYQHVGMALDSLSSIHDQVHDCYFVLCCVVFGAPSGRGTVSRMGPPKIKGRYSGMFPPVLLDEDLITDISDHMWWLACTDTHVHPEYLSRNLQFDIKSMASNGYDVEVKKYGYHPIYKHDLELSLLPMMDSGNSSAQKRKFLAIEENN